MEFNFRLIKGFLIGIEFSMGVSKHTTIDDVSKREKITPSLDIEINLGFFSIDVEIDGSPMETVKYHHKVGKREEE